MFSGLFEGAAELANAWSDFLADEAAAASQPDEDEDYQNARSDTDQIIAFFEREYDGREDSFSRYIENPEELEQLRHLRVTYLNCTNSIDHQNEQISVAMEELLSARGESRKVHLHEKFYKMYTA